MMRWCAIGLVLGCVLAAKPAFAQREMWRDWYGWQLMAADVAAGALVLAPVDDDARGATVGVGMTALFMNGAFVHMPNHNPKRASLSLFRLPAFLTGRLAGFGLGHAVCRQTGCKEPMQTWGGIIALGRRDVVGLGHGRAACRQPMGDARPAAAGAATGAGRCSASPRD